MTTTMPMTHRQMWPVWLLLAFEIVGFLFVWQMPFPVTRLSGGTAVIFISTAILLIVIRPQAATRLTAGLLIAFAGLLIVPLELGSLPIPQGAPLFDIPSHLLLRLFNGLTLFPLAFHWSARFPERSDGANVSWINSAAILLAYVTIYGLGTTFLLLPLGLPRQITVLLLIGACGLLTAVSSLQLIRISRDTHPAFQRAAQQARLLLLGVWLAEGLLLLRLPLFFLDIANIPTSWVLLTQIFIPATMAYAILRLDLFEIDVVVRRALGYSGVTAVLLAVYFGFTLLLTLALTILTPRFQGFVILLSLLISAVMFRPLSQRVRQTVDQLLYPERLAFRQTMQDARQILGQVGGRTSLLMLVTQFIPHGIGATGAALSIAPAPDVPKGMASPPVWNASLIVDQQHRGRYWMGERQNGLPYNQEERDALQTLSQQIGLALAYADALDGLNALNQNLERQVVERSDQLLSQQRTLAAAQERQRLARDLHDSVTQTLFSINLGARALQKMVLADPETAVSALRDQEKAAQQALAEMRALLSQLRNPLIVDGDFAAALRTHCAMLPQSGLTVTLTAPATLKLPPQMASELFNIAREALHNVLKHSGVAEATCTLTQQADEIMMVVADDGVGFDPSAQSGMGLRGMKERVVRLGGIVEVETAVNHGTTLRITIPQIKNKTDL